MKELLWPGGGANRMWFASQGFVQNEHGDWVRPEDPIATRAPASLSQPPAADPDATLVRPAPQLVDDDRDDEKYWRHYYQD